MLLHVLMFWGLLPRPAGRSDWPAENYPVCTSRVTRKASTGPLSDLRYNVFGIELMWFIIITYRDGDNPDRLTPRTLLAAIP